jgi:hypothetical protein
VSAEEIVCAECGKTVAFEVSHGDINVTKFVCPACYDGYTDMERK